MATKKSKTNVARRAKKQSFKFKWWMAVIGVVMVAGVGIAVLRFSNAGTVGAPAPKGPIYWIGDSLSTHMMAYTDSRGSLQTKLQASGFTPAFINQNPGRSITQAGFSAQNALQAVDADNKNYCPNATDPAIINYCKSNNNEYNPIKTAKTIVLFIGTNPETSTDSFSDLQNQLLNKLRAINPNARYVWGDIGSPGSKAKATSDESVNFERAFHPELSVEATRKKLADAYDAGRLRIQNNLFTIYRNSTSLNYSIISQFKFLWGVQSDISQLVQKSSLPDPNGYLTADGVHYTTAGAPKLADYAVATLNAGSFGTTASIPNFVDLSTQLRISLTEPPSNIVVSQPGVSDTGCKQQNGFKTNSTFKGCIVTSATPLQIKSKAESPNINQRFLFPNKKLTICVGSISADSTKPLLITLSSKGVVVSTIVAPYGTANDLAKLVACGSTSTPINDVDSITVSSPVLTYMNSMVIEVAN